MGTEEEYFSRISIGGDIQPTRNNVFCKVYHFFSLNEHLLSPFFSSCLVLFFLASIDGERGAVSLSTCLFASTTSYDNLSYSLFVWKISPQIVIFVVVARYNVVITIQILLPLLPLSPFTQNLIPCSSQLARMPDNPRIRTSTRRKIQNRIVDLTWTKLNSAR